LLRGRVDEAFFDPLPDDDLAAPDVDHQVEVEPHAPHAGKQVGDVPDDEIKAKTSVRL
jgi:hypothetical protein